MFDNIININWSDFHFLRPIFLWLTLPAFLVLVIGLFSLQEQVRWKKIIAPHLQAYMIRKGSENLKRRMQIILFLIISIAIFGLAGPSWKKIEIPGKTLETPLTIILDLSQSMMATDIQPNRLERAKFKIMDLLDANPGARIALIGFAGTAHTIVPLTHDYNIIKSHLKNLSPDVIPFPGSNFEDALVLADTITKMTSAPGTVLLFSDDFSEDTFKLLQGYINSNNNRVVIFPMNTSLGAVVPSLGSNKPMVNEKGEKVHSAMNNVVLNKIKSIDRIEISSLTLDKSDMELLAKNIHDDLEFKEKDEEKEDDWQDEGLWLVIPFAVLILLWFRKGWVIYSIVLVMGLSSCDGNFKFNDLWFTDDYQAQKLSDKGEYTQAAELFNDPLQKGVAYYKSGNFEDAIQAFKEDTTAMGAYNLGLAYYQNNDYAAAELAFGKAISLDPEMEQAMENSNKLQNLTAGLNEVDPSEAEEAQELQIEKNIENKDMEDLGGGGQEAKEEDLNKERKEETVSTDMRKGKEMEEVPEDFKPGQSDNSQKVLMRKVDDDPALFLKRKFKHQAKTKGLAPKNKDVKW